MGAFRRGADPSRRSSLRGDEGRHRQLHQGALTDGDEAERSGQCCRARPGWTPLIPATMPESTVKKFGADTAFGGPAQPVEIAPLFVFLASNEAQFRDPRSVTPRLVERRRFEFQLRERKAPILRCGGTGIARISVEAHLAKNELDDLTVVPLPLSESQAEHDRIRKSNDRDSAT